MEASILSLHIVEPNFDIENPGAERPDMAIKLLVLANVFFFYKTLMRSITSKEVQGLSL